MGNAHRRTRTEVFDEDQLRVKFESVLGQIGGREPPLRRGGAAHKGQRDEDGAHDQFPWQPLFKLGIIAGF